MPTNPRLRYASTPRGRLAYQVIEGGGAGYLIWVHWIVEHLDLMWTDPTVEAMITGRGRDNLTSIVLQPRGIGLSDPGSRAATIEEQAADLLAVMDAETIDRAVVCVLVLAHLANVDERHENRSRVR